MSDGHECVSHGEMLLTISTQGETIRGLLSRVDDLEVQDEAQWVTLRAERANAERLVTLERLEAELQNWVEAVDLGALHAAMQEVTPETHGTVVRIPEDGMEEIPDALNRVLARLEALAEGCRLIHDG